ncbi:MAG: PD-(D/E)XK nuclease domain-containing protein, partial [Selenomonadaceae bacterium]|nr:PD-(D/E)XK nuclease domain-containing protein [Selenomonadaceae bacterium]
RQKYLMVREFPTGKGFADLVFLPRPPFANLPALLLERKWDKAAETALKQIKTKNYPQSLKDYVGEILLVGISYDKGTRKHECMIEHCNVTLPPPTN